MGDAAIVIWCGGVIVSSAPEKCEYLILRTGECLVFVLEFQLFPGLLKFRARDKGAYSRTWYIIIHGWVGLRVADVGYSPPLRSGIVGMRGSMIIRLRPCMT